MTADTNVERVLTALRIICMAMILGIIAFGAVTTYLVGNGHMTTDPSLVMPLLPIVGLLAVAEVVAFVFVRRGVVDALHRAFETGDRATVPPERLAGSYNVLTIIGAGMAESISLLGVVIVLLSGNWLAMLAPLVGLLVLAALFPTRARYEAFAQRITGVS